MDFMAILNTVFFKCDTQHQQSFSSLLSQVKLIKLNDISLNFCKKLITNLKIVRLPISFQYTHNLSLKPRNSLT